MKEQQKKLAWCTSRVKSFVYVKLLDSANRVAIVANLGFALFLLWLLTLFLLFIRTDKTTLVLCVGVFLLTYLTLFLNIKVVKNITWLKSLNPRVDNLLKNLKKWSYHVYFPLIFLVFLGLFRTAVIEIIVDERTYHFSSEKTILGEKLKILKVLRDTGYVSDFTYRHKKNEVEHLLENFAKPKG